MEVIIILNIKIALTLLRSSPLEKIILLDTLNGLKN